MPSSLVVWSDHGRLMSRGLADLYKTRRFADLEINCLGSIFRVHRAVLDLFTDYFRKFDGVWFRLDVDRSHLETLLRFMYLGQAVIDYDQMEDFLQLCRRLRVQLFKDVALTDEAREDAGGSDGEDSQEEYSEEYQLSDFKLLCPKCYKCFETATRASMHRSACMKKATLRCKYCPKLFKFPNVLEDHERIVHTKERPFKCPREGCDRDFVLKQNMYAHVVSDHDMVRHRCPHCEKEFKWKGDLSHHVRSKHTGLRPFPCPECGKSFLRQSQVNAHMKKQHGTRGEKEPRVVHKTIKVKVDRRGNPVLAKPPQPRSKPAAAKRPSPASAGAKVMWFKVAKQSAPGEVQPGGSELNPND